MNHFNLLPSVNWNISHMLVVSEDGTVCAYGSRGDIIIIKNVHNDNLNGYETKFIPRAHKNHRVMGLSFVKVEVDGELVESLVSCGDDGRIKIWNIDSESMTHKCLLKKNSNTPLKLVDVDVFPQNNCIVSASENGTVLKWNVSSNKLWSYNVDPKIIIDCIAVCPHVEDLIAIGAQFGLVLIYSLKGEGKLRHRIRCHDNAVFSLSWCPVPYNALQLSKLREDENFDEEEWKKKDKTLLLASCSKDRSVYICKAGTNGYCEAVLTLPSKPVTNVPRYGNVPNTERGRYIKWIYPSVLLTFTDFNEMITVYMFSKNEQKNDTRQKVKPSSVKFDIKPLHNVHKRNISNFAVHLNSSEEVDFRVWSCSADRLLVRSGYRVNYKEKTITLPLLSGYIFCLDISPVNPDLLAIGTGDGKICIWNLSTDNYVDITTLSKKIDNKVMSLRWHPLYEGVLGFGTYEGRVGMFDLSQGRNIPTLFKLFHNKPIYKLCWAPPVSSDASGKAALELHLFAVGNGDILQFNPSSHNEIPVSLNAEILLAIEETCKCKHKSDLSYDTDRKLVAIGLSNGDVCICCAETLKLYHTITEQPKAIMSLAWHPKIVFDSPDKVSSCHNWLATAGENVFIYSIDPKGEDAPKKVASLEVHTNRVLSVAWSPHVNGRLLSCSADNTAIVWDVLNQTIIGRYSEHCAQVLCGIWSPVDKDLIVTGSADFTCRMWSVSKDTVNKITEAKKTREKIIEPTILSASNLNDSLPVDTSISTSFTKNSKHHSFLPTVAPDFHHSLLLEKVFADAIDVLSGNKIEDAEKSQIKCNGEVIEKLPDSEDDSVQKGKSDEKVDEKVDKNSTNTNPPECNYAQVFGTDDQLLKLVLHEERALESSGNMSEYFVLNQTRYDLNNRIKEAMNKNQVTEQILALAPSVSPKLWKEACQVYIEQMIKSDNIFQAVNYQLALGKDDEAIELLCEKNRFKEAFTMARLRSKEETVKAVLEKWIRYCYNCGLYRLGAHCYMFLKDEQNACTFLNKSKLLKDIILATKLLKYYQPKRAIELATECFKKHLSQLSHADVEVLFGEFPEIKFIEPWYTMLKYFKEEQPSTGAITKWILGMQNDNVIPLPNDNVDYAKLRAVVVDNTFNMNYEQLMTYVSALAALYVSGISREEYAQSALRNYIRGLSHCYNYKIINSNRVLSDAAYPMMRLLKLMFPAGLFESVTKDVESNDESLSKSIKAYYCDFIFTWLVHCDDLPKSLKTLEQNELGGGDKIADKLESDVLENFKDRFDVIREQKTKLQKVVDLFTLYVTDVLDTATVSYYRETAALKKLENTVSSKQKVVENGKDSIEEQECSSLKLSADEAENEKMNVSVQSLNGTSNSEIFDENVSAVESTENGIDEGTKTVTELENVSNENNTAAEMKIIKELIDEFEKQRVSAPNPFYFYCIAKEYIEKSRGIDDDLTSKLETMLTRCASKCGINKD